MGRFITPVPSSDEAHTVFTTSLSDIGENVSLHDAAFIVASFAPL